MNRKRLRGIVRNVLLIIVLLFALIRTLGYYIRPENLFRDSELSLNYGPSEIVHREKDSQGNIYILSKYGKNFYLASLKNQFKFLYSIGSQSIMENQGRDIEIGLNYSKNREEKVTLYGLVNNGDIVEVEVSIGGKKILIDEFYEDMFLKILRTEDYQGVGIKGFNQEGELLFEENY